MRIHHLYKIFFVAAATFGLACSCGDGNKEPDYEQQGQVWLNRARTSLRDTDYQLARIYIDSLRERCSMALNAREEAIILLDSIDLAEAREQLHQAKFLAGQTGLDYIARDSVDTNLDRAQAKVAFFEKKLSLDIARKEKH